MSRCVREADGSRSKFFFTRRIGPTPINSPPTRPTLHQHKRIKHVLLPFIGSINDIKPWLVKYLWLSDEDLLLLCRVLRVVVLHRHVEQVDLLQDLLDGHPVDAARRDVVVHRGGGGAGGGTHARVAGDGDRHLG